RPTPRWTRCTQLWDTHRADVPSWPWPDRLWPRRYCSGHWPIPLKHVAHARADLPATCSPIAWPSPWTLYASLTPRAERAPPCGRWLNPSWSSASTDRSEEHTSEL